MDIKLNPDDLTLDEVEEFEEITGVGIDAAFADGKPKAKVLKALVFVVGRRDNPDLTMDEVGAMKVSSIVGEADGGPALPSGSASKA